MTAAKKQAKAEALEKKWAERRKKLPHQVLCAVYIECGHKCANPNCRFSLILEAHHILWVKDGGDDQPENLLALCPNCHGMHTRGMIGYEAIWHWKQMLVMLNRAYDKQGIDQLLFLHKTAHAGIWCDGGSVERYAALISGGLVEVTNTVHKMESGISMLPAGAGLAAGSRFETRFVTSSHTLGLTQRGQMLVEAWLSADHKKYEELLAQQALPKQPC